MLQLSGSHLSEAKAHPPSCDWVLKDLCVVGRQSYRLAGLLMLSLHFGLGAGFTFQKVSLGKKG